MTMRTNWPSSIKSYSASTRSSRTRTRKSTANAKRNISSTNNSRSSANGSLRASSYARPSMPNSRRRRSGKLEPVASKRRWFVAKSSNTTMRNWATS